MNKIKNTEMLEKEVLFYKKQTFTNKDMNAS
jgi:hypothetical protein